MHPNPKNPNPGSAEAQAQGCTCAVIDNCHGRGMPYPGGPRWWINGDCPMHAKKKEEKENAQ